MATYSPTNETALAAAVAAIAALAAGDIFSLFVLVVLPVLLLLLRPCSTVSATVANAIAYTIALAFEITNAFSFSIGVFWFLSFFLVPCALWLVSSRLPLMALLC